MASSECFTINLKTKKVKKAASMTIPRKGHSVNYHNGYIYAFGGAADILFPNSFTNQCERYSLREEFWEQVTDLSSVAGDVGTCLSL
mmetsp:Transcript_34154/g.6156  ORF Transcript_34154/g.6156 Transcript_34154/m.6156 type:complete len:87 (-) Transcript_34154:220-480(-)